MFLSLRWLNVHWMFSTEFLQFLTFCFQQVLIIKWWFFVLLCTVIWSNPSKVGWIEKSWLFSSLRKMDLVQEKTWRTWNRVWLWIYFRTPFFTEVTDLLVLPLGEPFPFCQYGNVTAIYEKPFNKINAKYIRIIPNIFQRRGSSCLWQLKPSLDRLWHQCCALLGLKTGFNVIKLKTDVHADVWESAVSSHIAFFSCLVTQSCCTNAALNCISEPCKGLKGDDCTSAARSKSWEFRTWRPEIHQMQRSGI